MKLQKKVRSTEVKLVLDSEQVLDSEFELTDDIRTAFKVENPPYDMRIWYLDTAGQHMMRENWSVRFRYHEKCDFELTYKKRFTEHEFGMLFVTGSKNAFADFEPEIDLGFSKKTYSLSYIKTFPQTEELKNLTSHVAKHLAIVYAPSALLDWHGRNKGLKWLDSAVMYGPVYAMEHQGKYDGTDVSFEIWKLDCFFSEISLDIKTEKSEKMRDQLRKELQEKHLALPQNTLKTQALFDYYAEHPELLTR